MAGYDLDRSGADGCEVEVGFGLGVLGDADADNDKTDDYWAKSGCEVEWRDVAAKDGVVQSSGLVADDAPRWAKPVLWANCEDGVDWGGSEIYSSC